MADTEAIRQQVQSRAPFSTWLGVIFLFLLFGAIVLAVVGPAPRGDNYEQARAEKRVEKLKALTDANAKQLTSYGWIDKNKGSVHLPIDRAMELAVTELAAKKPGPAYPIATPTPETTGGAASASPAPAASPPPSGTTRPAASPQSSALPAPAASPSPSASAAPAGSPSPARAKTASPT